MDSGGRREKAGERRFRRDGTRRKEDPEPRYEHRCRCARLPANTLAVLLLDADPEDALGGWLANCWRSDFEVLDRIGPERDLNALTEDLAAGRIRLKPQHTPMKTLKPLWPTSQF